MFIITNQNLSDLQPGFNYTMKQQIIDCSILYEILTVQVRILEIFHESSYFKLLKLLPFVGPYQQLDDWRYKKP